MLIAIGGATVKFSSDVVDTIVISEEFMKFLQSGTLAVEVCRFHMHIMLLYLPLRSGGTTCARLMI